MFVHTMLFFIVTNNFREEILPLDTCLSTQWTELLESEAWVAQTPGVSGWMGCLLLVLTEGETMAAAGAKYYLFTLHVHNLNEV